MKRHLFLSTIWLLIFLHLNASCPTTLATNKSGTHYAIKSPDDFSINLCDNATTEYKTIKSTQQTPFFGFCCDSLFIPTKKSVYVYGPHTDVNIIPITSLALQNTKPLALACWHNTNNTKGRIAIAFQRAIANAEDAPPITPKKYCTEFVLLNHTSLKTTQEESYYLEEEQADYDFSSPVSLAFNQDNPNQLIFGFSKRHNQHTQNLIIIDEKTDTGSTHNTEAIFFLNKIQWKNNVIGVLGTPFNDDTGLCSQSSALTLYKVSEGTLTPFITLTEPIINFSILSNNLLIYAFQKKHSTWYKTINIVPLSTEENTQHTYKGPQIKAVDFTENDTNIIIAYSTLYNSLQKTLIPKPSSSSSSILTYLLSIFEHLPSVFRHNIYEK